MKRDIEMADYENKCNKSSISICLNIFAGLKVYEETKIGIEVIALVCHPYIIPLCFVELLVLYI